ncbi:MAG: DEAD/DEAH box helicase [Isosphaeraceae bacterium]
MPEDLEPDDDWKADIKAYYEPDGKLASSFGKKFEIRPQQRDMAIAIGDAISAEHHLVVEAGTGVGKSFAYLIPAILYAVNEGKKVVVSTHTIALQEQILRKDIPRLKKILPLQGPAGQGPLELYLSATPGNGHAAAACDV